MDVRVDHAGQDNEPARVDIGTSTAFNILADGNDAPIGNREIARRGGSVRQSQRSVADKEVVEWHWQSWYRGFVSLHKEYLVLDLVGRHSVEKRPNSLRELVSIALHGNDDTAMSLCLGNILQMQSQKVIAVMREETPALSSGKCQLLMILLPQHLLVACRYYIHPMGLQQRCYENRHILIDIERCE